MAGYACVCKKRHRASGSPPFGKAQCPLLLFMIVPPNIVVKLTNDNKVLQVHAPLELLPELAHDVEEAILVIVYIYIYRERERNAYVHMYTCTHVHISLFDFLPRLC